MNNNMKQEKDQLKVVSQLNFWQMKNKQIMQQFSVLTPSGWLEQDCVTNCD